MEGKPAFNPRVKRALGKLKDILINKKTTVGVEDDPSNITLSLFRKETKEGITEYFIGDGKPTLKFE